MQLYLQHLVFVTPLLLSAAIVEELEPVWVCCGWSTPLTAHSKWCDELNTHISSKFHIIFISYNNDRRPVTNTFNPLHYFCRHFTSTHLNFTQLHFTNLSFGLNPFNILPLHFTSHHYTSPHFTSLHCNFRWFSPNFYSFHFTPFIIAFLTLLLNIYRLPSSKIQDSKL
jgi:hypothetical protein